MTLHFLRGTVSCAVALLAITAAGSRPRAAGVPPARPPAASRARPAATRSSPAFRASTELVQVDVVVDDSKGRFVPDLTRNDFQVFEDGKRQPIETFSLLGVPTGGTPSAAAAPAARPAPAAAMPAERRILIMVFDDRHLQPGGFTNVQRAAEQLLDDDFRNGDIGGVVTNGGMLGNHLTTDREELLTDIAKVKPRSSALTERYNLREWPRLLGVEEAQQIVNGDSLALSQAVNRAEQEMPPTKHPVDVTPNVREKAREVVDRAQTDANETLNTLAILLAGLAKFPGPKSVVFFSDGFFSDPSWPQLQQVVGLAARAGVRIYAVDARGLNLTGTNETELDPGRADAGSSLYAPTMDSGTSGPNSLAVDTGGFVTRYTNNFAQALERIAEDGQVYYLIGYRPTNADFNGKFRTIRVKVTRRGLTVRARRGYLAIPTPAAPVSTTSTSPSPTARPGGLPAQPAPTATPSAPAAPPAPGASAPASISPSGPAVLPKGLAHIEQLQQAESAGATADRPGAPRAPGAQPPAAPSEPAVPLGGPPHIGQPRQVPPTGATAGQPAAPAETAQPETGQRVTPAADAPAEARRAWAFYQQGNLEAAATAFARAVADPGAHPWVYYAYGLTEYGLSQFGDAIAQWERVRAAVPEFEPVYFDLADGYMRAGDAQKALKVLRTAARRWATDPQVFNAMGVIQVRLGVLDDAARSFEQATKVAPDDGLGYFNLGKALELRYVRSKRYVSSTGASTANDRDRRDAIAAFQRYVKIGGPFASSASQELLRLQYEGIAKQPR